MPQPISLATTKVDSQSRLQSQQQRHQECSGRRWYYSRRCRVIDDASVAPAAGEVGERVDVAHGVGLLGVNETCGRRRELQRAVMPAPPPDRHDTQPSTTDQLLTYRLHTQVGLTRAPRFIRL